MPKLYSARVILSALQRAGFVIVGQKGSHIKLYKKYGSQHLTVIVPNHKEVAMGTFSSILKQASTTKKEFERLVR
ncbi:MAG: type II toxin-antitoxin system HicA family toxin [Patescibacteria group bacterium]